MFKTKKLMEVSLRRHYSGNYSLALNYRWELQLKRDLCAKKTQNITTDHHPRQDEIEEA